MMLKPRVLSQNEIEPAVLLIKEYEHIFTGPDGKVGFTDVAHHDINAASSVEEVSSRPGKTFIRGREKMLANGQTRPLKSPWWAPVVLVRKMMDLYESFSKESCISVTPH